MKRVTIGITDCSKWKNYHDWIASDEVDVIKLSPKEDNLSDLEKCDGLVLSGGEDVHPKYYGHPEWMERKDELKLDVNEARDAFEMKVIDKAYKNKIPMLGICRGLQIANVYFKGTLIPDIKTENLKVHSKDTSADKIHNIVVDTNSCLSAILSIDDTNSSPPPEGGRWRGATAVNSAHHQAADKIGEGLRVSARSADGTVEALELKDPKQHPFLLLVQWHPERVTEQKSPFASGLKERFLQEVRKR